MVTPLIPLETQPHPGWGIWPDICDDDRVAYMEQRIADRQPFTKTMWPGGDTSEVFITFPNAAVGLKTKKRSTHSRKTGGKNKKLRDAIGIRASARKQRRISTYFSRVSTSTSQHDKVLELLSGLSNQFGAFQQQFKRFTSRCDEGSVIPHASSRPSNLCYSLLRHPTKHLTCQTKDARRIRLGWFMILQTTTL